MEKYVREQMEGRLKWEKISHGWLKKDQNGDSISVAQVDRSQFVIHEEQNN